MPTRVAVRQAHIRAEPTEVLEHRAHHLHTALLTIGNEGEPNFVVQHLIQCRLEVNVELIDRYIARGREKERGP